MARGGSHAPKQGVGCRLLCRQKHKFISFSSIAVRGKSRAPLLMRRLFGFPDKSSSWGLGQSLEETTEYRRGWTPPAPERSEEPPVIAQQHEKSRRDDRDISNLILNRLCTLSPFQGLVLLMFLYRGFFPSVRRRRRTPPSVFFRTLTSSTFGSALFPGQQ